MPGRIVEPGVKTEQRSNQERAFVEAVMHLNSMKLRYLSDAVISRYIRDAWATVMSKSGGRLLPNAELNDLTDKQFNKIATEVIQIVKDAENRVMGYQLLRAAWNGEAGKIGELIDKGAPVNFQDPRSGATALHYVAAYRARPAFRALAKSGQCDFLIRDNKGRLAWELASDADDAALARLLIYKTAKQAETQGLPIPPRREPARP